MTRRANLLRGVLAALTISLVSLAIVAMNGASLFIALSIRDGMGKMGKRLDTQTARINRLIEYLEGDQGKAKKRRNQDAKN